MELGGMHKIKVFLVDDQDVVRRGIALCYPDNRGFRIRHGALNLKLGSVGSRGKRVT